MDGFVGPMNEHDADIYLHFKLFSNNNLIFYSPSPPGQGETEKGAELWIQLPFRAVSAGSSCYFLSGSILYSLLAIGMKRGKILT